MVNNDIEKGEEKLIKDMEDIDKELIKNKNKFTKEEFKTLTASRIRLKKLKLNTDMVNNKINQKNDEITQNYWVTW